MITKTYPRCRVADAAWQPSACADVYTLPQCGTLPLLTLEGQHWMLRAVRLKAFTDDNDTLCETTARTLFAGNIMEATEGELFFLEDPESGAALFIASEAPDYQRSTLSVRRGAVSLDNGGNAAVLGFCRRGECEAACRAYYRSCLQNKIPAAMSNTWGDRNGFSRVCEEFVLREIEAAKEIGIDIVQVDDGWQAGSTADKALRDEKNRRFFPEGFWTLNRERFPGGMEKITAAAREAGLKAGMWFAPDSHDHFALLERDAAVLRRAYDEWGVRFFKLDMYWIEDAADRDRFLSLLETVYSFGDDVAVQLDTTRNLRVNYLCGKQYGTIFVENRYTKSANSFPHRILRNLWSIGHYLPTTRFQFEVVNPDLNTDCYAADDPFVPSLYSMDYLFAAVMVSCPLFWMELQFLPEKRRAELAPILSLWREIRGDFAESDIEPIGEMPCGRSFTGFHIKNPQGRSYLLVFRELTDSDSFIFPAHGAADGMKKVLISNADVQAEVRGGAAHVRFSAPRSYALIEL